MSETINGRFFRMPEKEDQERFLNDTNEVFFLVSDQYIDDDVASKHIFLTSSNNVKNMTVEDIFKLKKNDVVLCERLSEEEVYERMHEQLMKMRNK